MAAEHFGQGDGRSLKHAALNLADGIELVLKARLAAHDWRLLFTKPADADRPKFRSGNFYSVSMDDCVSRLEEECGIIIPPSFGATLQALRLLRNKIRHFAVTTNRETMMGLLTRAYSFTLDFISEHLELEDDRKIAAEIAKLRKLLPEISEFVEHRLKEIDPRVAQQSYAEHLECARCFQEALYPEDGEVVCAFCGYRRDGEAAADDWVEVMSGPRSPKDKAMEELIDHCPECSAFACVAYAGSTTWSCFACGEAGDYAHCAYCGRLFGGEANPGGRCDECWDYLLSKD